jgi:hypothetical protein
MYSSQNRNIIHALVALLPTNLLPKLHARMGRIEYRYFPHTPTQNTIL